MCDCFGAGLHHNVEPATKQQYSNGFGDPNVINSTNCLGPHASTRPLPDNGKGKYQMSCSDAVSISLQEHDDDTPDISKEQVSVLQMQQAK